MLKYKLIFLFLLGIALQGRSQMATVDVGLNAQAAITNSNLATSNSTLGGMSGALAALEKADKYYKEAMKKATWLRNMQTAQRLLAMIENLVCTTKNLTVRLGAIGHESCLYNYRYDMGIIKIQQSVDYLTIILSGSASLTTGERMKTLNDVITAFEESQEVMAKLNKSMDDDLARVRLSNGSANSLITLHKIDRRKRR